MISRWSGLPHVFRCPRALARPLPLLLVPLLLAGGCDGIQSALSPAGTGASQIADLFWVMTVSTAVIWVVVLGIAVYATRVSPRPHPQRAARMLIIGGGIILPTIALCALLIYGLRLMPPLRAADDGLRIEVSGEQWWWRVTYRPTNGRPVASANEVRLPRGERVEIAVVQPGRHPLVLDPVARRQDGHDPRPRQRAGAGADARPAFFAAPAPSSAAPRTR